MFNVYIRKMYSSAIEILKFWQKIIAVYFVPYMTSYNLKTLHRQKPKNKKEILLKFHHTWQIYVNHLRLRQYNTKVWTTRWEKELIWRKISPQHETMKSLHPKKFPTCYKCRWLQIDSDENFSLSNCLLIVFLVHFILFFPLVNL